MSTIPIAPADVFLDPLHGRSAPEGSVSGVHEADDAKEPTQVPIDSIDEASMESFPCSDPPSYTMRHS